MAGADGHEDRPGGPHTRRDPVGPAGVAIGEHDSISGGRAAAELVHHAKEDGLIAVLPGCLHVAHRRRQIRRRAARTVGSAYRLGWRQYAWDAREHFQLRIEGLETVDPLALGLRDVAEHHI